MEQCYHKPINGIVYTAFGLGLASFFAGSHFSSSFLYFANEGWNIVWYTDMDT